MPAILGHRVVTLHPKIHGGILADPDDPDHRRDLAEHGIEPIDLVVVNLYPFASDPGIELIDIGGPAMVRAAAKNHAHVGVVVDPGRLPAGARRAARPTAGWLRRHAAGWPATAFASTAGYDAADRRLVRRPADGLAERGRRSAAGDLDLRSSGPRRCGTARTRTSRRARYRRRGSHELVGRVVQHGGKELSYLNLFDTEAAWRLVQRFDRAGVRDRQARQPVRRRRRRRHRRRRTSVANACDPVSAFGGIVAVNRPVPAALAEALAPVFTEVVVAPGYDDDALDDR